MELACVLHVCCLCAGHACWLTRPGYSEYLSNGVIVGDKRVGGGAARPHLFTPEECDWIVREVRRRPTAYLDELAYDAYRKTGKYASVSTMFRVLREGGLSVKLIHKLHFAKNEDNKAVFAQAVSGHDFREGVWMDETAQQDRKNFRKRGRSRKGRRVRVKMPKFNNERWTIAATMSYLGPGPCRLLRGSLKAEGFLDYMEQDVLPRMEPHYNADGSLTGLPLSVLILDNCSTHRCSCCSAQEAMCVCVRVSNIRAFRTNVRVCICVCACVCLKSTYCV